MEQLCGNGILELGEQCDDGNLDEGDGCNTSCRVDDCSAQEFDSTYEAIQSVIFDNPVYECTNAACHGTAASGDLDLRPNASFAELVGVPGNFNQIRVVPGAPDESLQGLTDQVLVLGPEELEQVPCDGVAVDLQHRRNGGSAPRLPEQSDERQRDRPDHDVPRPDQRA